MRPVYHFVPLTFAVALFGIFLVGCNRDVTSKDVTNKREESRDAQKEAEQARTKAAEKQRAADQKTSEATQVEAKFLAQENKKDYEREMRFGLDQMKERIDMFKSAEKNVSDAVRADHKVAVTHLQELYDRADKRLGDVKSAPAEDWATAKKEANVAWRDLVTAYNDDDRRFR